MKKIILISILYSLLLSSCGLIAHFKIIDAFEVETISSQPFKEELSFEEVNGTIIIEVEIEGSVKKFIFDTGATTKLDKNFAATIKTKKLGKKKTFDSNNNKRHIKYVTLEKLNIGKVSFYDIVASISDMEQLNTAACLEVAGIIGANAMNKCIWQIDYQAKKIIFTNHRDSLNLPKKENKINFSAVGKGVPTISLYSNGNYCGEAIFDTGSNGGIEIDEQYMTDSSNYLEKQVYSFGIFSHEILNQKLTIASSVELDQTFPVNNQLVSFEKNLRRGYIGNKFLKDYKVTFDWMYQQVYFDKYESVAPSTYTDFGFYPRFVEDKVLIASIRPNSEIYNLGLRLNDVVVEINGIRFTENIHENYCKYLKERSNWEKVKLIVRKENRDVELNVEKKNLVEILNKNK